MIDKLLHFLNVPFFRYLLIPLMYLNYIRKGFKVNAIKYLNEYHKWYFKINGISFISTGPGWAYSYEFLLSELKRISGHAYLPKEGDVVIDIGAGIGEETIVISKLIGPRGMVYSMEANPVVYKSLKFILEDNRLANVKVFNMAIADETKPVEIEDDSEAPNDYLANSILTSRENRRTIQVQGISLDDFVKTEKINTINLLRTNIEGAEQLMIKGMKDSVQRIHHVSISCHDFRFNNGESEFFKTKEIIVSYLTANGFKISFQSTGNPVVDDYIYGSR